MATCRAGSAWAMSSSVPAPQARSSANDRTRRSTVPPGRATWRPTATYSMDPAAITIADQRAGSRIGPLLRVGPSGEVLRVSGPPITRGVYVAGRRSETLAAVPNPQTGTVTEEARTRTGRLAP